MLDCAKAPDPPVSAQVRASTPPVLDYGKAPDPPISAQVKASTRAARNRSQSAPNPTPYVAEVVVSPMAVKFLNLKGQGEAGEGEGDGDGGDDQEKQG